MGLKKTDFLKPVSNDIKVSRAKFRLQVKVFFFFFAHDLTQICFYHDIVNSTNHKESDLFDTDLGHIYMWS